MPRIRGLKPDFFKDEYLAELPFEARLLFSGLWCYADKKGRLEDRPKYLKAELFPYDKVDIEKMLNLLANPKLPDRPDKVFIRRYMIEGIQYIDIPTFLEHQTPHHTEKESRIPEFNGDLTVKLLRKKDDTVHCSLFIEKEKEKEKEKDIYGEFKNVFLSKEEYLKLKNKFNSSLNEKIEALSQGIASKGYKYKSHYATILSWDRKNNSESIPSKGKSQRNIDAVFKKMAEMKNDRTESEADIIPTYSRISRD